jgi:hypothetical protein
MSPGQAYVYSVTQTGAQIGADLEDIGVKGLQKLNDELADAVTGAKSLGEVFHNVANQIISDLVRIAIQQAIIKPLAQLLFGGGNTGGGIFSILGSLFGGGGSAPAAGLGDVYAGGGLSDFWSFLTPRAAGGPVNAGRAYRVGEHGMEVFVPNQSGTIIPNGATATPQGGAGAWEVHVVPSPYFDVQVRKVAAPDIARGSIQGAYGGAIMARANLGREALHRLE